MLFSINHIPLIRLLIPFITGIILFNYFPSSNPFTSYLFGGIVLLCILLLLIKPLNANFKFKWIFGVLIHIGLLLGGYNLSSLKSTSSFSLNKSDEQIMIGEIITPPQVKEKTVKTTLEIKGIHSNSVWKTTEGKIIVFINKDSLAQTLKLGNFISFNPKIQNVPEPKNPNEFDYKKYLSYHLISQQSYLQSDNWKIIENKSDNSLYTLANDIREYLINTLRNNHIIDNQLGVASALILGYKNEIDAQLKSAYSNAGAMHVLAVSGLHVGVIYMIFNLLLKFLEKIKYGTVLKAIVILFILWFYALITGLSPSVLRASTMFSFVVVAKTTHRNSNFFNTLAASAFLLLIINPYLIMDVGFQLSYAAVAGIVLMQPWLSNLYESKYWLIQQIWNLTTVSIAAQIATFPIGLYYFHQFPNYFMLSNLLVIPLAILILYLGLAIFVTSFIPFVSEKLGWLLNKTISFLNYGVQQIDALPHSVSENIRFTLSDTLLIYSAIVCIMLLFHFRKFKYFVLASSFITIFLIHLGFTNYQLINQKKLIIYNIPNYSAINFIDGNDNILLSDFKLYNNQSKLMYHVKNNWIDKGIESEKIVDLNKLKKQHLVSNIYRISNPNLFTKLNYFQYYQTKIGIIDQNVKELETIQKTIDLDILIWSKNNKLDLKNVVKNYRFKQLIIDSSNSSYTNNKLIEQAKELNLSCWSVLNQGAFSQNIF